MDMHDRFRAMAIRNLSPRSSGGNGIEIVLTKKEGGVYNPATSKYEGGYEAPYGCSGIRTSFKSFAVDGNLVRVDDLLIYLSPVLLSGNDTPTPLKGDKITIKGKTYIVVSQREWDFSGITCGWRVQARLGS